MKGLIFDIKHFAIHDGPGIRTTVFLKGCPLSCNWCHNPESQLAHPEKITRIDRIGEQQFEREEIIGKYYSIEEIVEIIEEDRAFFETSGGGVTFSGGEPMQQLDFLTEALTTCKDKGIHTVVDTSGMVSTSSFEQVMPYTDLFLYDIKHLDVEKHKQFTGSSNIQILNNFEFLLENKANVIIRVPIIPGFNDDKPHFENLKMYLNKFQHSNLKAINLLPYHLTRSKYQRCDKLDLLHEYEEPSVTKMKELNEFIQLK